MAIDSIDRVSHEVVEHSAVIASQQAANTGQDARAATSLVHALSFDIEDWFHIVDVPAVDDPTRWPSLSDTSSIVERYTDLILEICDTYDVKATFFVLGWVAARHPDLVRRIFDSGHELATHSHWHRPVYTMNVEALIEDLQESIDAIKAAAPEAEVLGFRAPSFSITPGSEWAFDAILDAGLRYDASLFPSDRGHGGYICRRGVHEVRTPSGRTLPELPMSIARIGVGPLQKNLCYSGGGYLRLLPLTTIEYGMRQEAKSGRPTVVYLHPRDFAPDSPRVSMPLHRRFKCYVGLRTTRYKLESLLDVYQWDTCRGMLNRNQLLS